MTTLIPGCPDISWPRIRRLPILQGRQLGTVHVLKDITDRKRAEEKYRTLVSNVQEGVFISTPAGRFLDFNDALMRMLGYEHREELQSVDIPVMYVNASDRERLKKLLQEHGSVADFEFEIRRRDGEVRTMMESSIAVRDAGGQCDRVSGIPAGYHGPETSGAGNPAAQSRADGVELDRADAYGVDGPE